MFVSILVVHVDLPYRRLPLAFWKDISAQHFKTATGAYEGRDNLQTGCVSLAKHLEGVGQKPTRDADTLNALCLPFFRAAGSIIVSDNDLTTDLWEYHRKGECTHFCFPSAPQIWVHTFYRSMLKHRWQFRPLEEL